VSFASITVLSTLTALTAVLSLLSSPSVTLHCPPPEDKSPAVNRPGRGSRLNQAPPLGSGGEAHHTSAGSDGAIDTGHTMDSVATNHVGRQPSVMELHLAPWGHAVARMPQPPPLPGGRSCMVFTAPLVRAAPVHPSRTLEAQRHARTPCWYGIRCSKPDCYYLHQIGSPVLALAARQGVFDASGLFSVPAPRHLATRPVMVTSARAAAEPVSIVWQSGSGSSAAAVLPRAPQPQRRSDLMQVPYGRRSRVAFGSAHH